ncbi:hypothetical protein LEP1GSC060_1314 [Leptospira weilii serovar Ranarum str. ICFT]|uniref:Uncharacterized protein n=1 Tax=Leptospira weilii serovar Ranarum str. ICFT TaxID=1218598 RepID=N1WH73_9LEPT|nr:hypothetical protein LEP1GSC060_1314 [Leptospira weilii serovar Ranarum str. ICFT]
MGGNGKPFRLLESESTRIFFLLEYLKLKSECLSFQELGNFLQREDNLIYESFFGDESYFCGSSRVRCQ